jgi:hypothetical protein
MVSLALLSPSPHTVTGSIIGDISISFVNQTATSITVAWTRPSGLPYPPPLPLPLLFLPLSLPSVSLTLLTQNYAVEYSITCQNTSRAVSVTFSISSADLNGTLSCVGLPSDITFNVSVVSSVGKAAYLPPLSILFAFFLLQFVLFKFILIFV